MKQKNSFKNIVKKYPSKFAITWSLVLIEGLSILALPMLVGISIDALLNNSYKGLYILLSVCICALIIASARRWYDTRSYATIFKDMSHTVIKKNVPNKTNSSKTIARINFLNEIMTFAEYSIPELINHLISFIGTIIILSFMSLNLLLGCLFSTAVIVVIYLLCENKITSHNTNQNNVLEEQAHVIMNGTPKEITNHFNLYMKWKIKLSDVETLNYSIIWITLTSLLVFSIISVVNQDSMSYGLKITAIIYIFEYIDNVMSFPVYYQQYIRLKEIMSRI